MNFENCVRKKKKKRDKTTSLRSLRFVNNIIIAFRGCYFLLHYIKIDFDMSYYGILQSSIFDLIEKTPKRVRAMIRNFKNPFNIVLLLYNNIKPIKSKLYFIYVYIYMQN